MAELLQWVLLINRILNTKLTGNNCKKRTKDHEEESDKVEDRRNVTAKLAFTLHTLAHLIFKASSWCLYFLEGGRGRVDSKKLGNLARVRVGRQWNQDSVLMLLKPIWFLPLAPYLAPQMPNDSKNDSKWSNGPQTVFQWVGTGQEELLVEAIL